ncbi:MAG: dethiobiotin synthase [Candidatus Methylopumilus sp.]|jgi:dethiobiotin synthetase
MQPGYFITGTDTGVGKTLVASALVYQFAQRGFKSVGMKPVAAGCELVNGELVSEDVAQLVSASNMVVPVPQINPYAFAPAIAPHLAAEMVGVEIELGTIQQAYSMLAAQAEVVVVEGVGGFCVPLSDSADTADLATALALPVMMVVGMRLGCLNHALLTVAAIKARGLTLAGWIVNSIDPNMAMFEENLSSLKQRIDAPCLGVIPWQREADFRLAASYLASSAPSTTTL